MGGIIWVVILFVLVALTAGVLVRISPFRRLGIDESVMPAATSVTERIRLRNLLALVAAIVVGAALVWFAFSVRSDLGRTLFLAPILSAATGILFFSVIPAFRESAAVRSADLAPRTPLSFANRRTFVLAGIFLALVVAVVIACGVVATSHGRSFTRQSPLFTMAAGPFPGFFYGVPVLAAAALLAGVVVLAVVRIARAPRPSDDGLRDADSALRRLAIGVVLRAAAAGCAATVAGFLFLASNAVTSVSGGIEQNGLNGPEIPPDTVLQVLAVLGHIGAAIFVVVALVFAITAVSGALRKPLELLVAPA